MIERKEVIESNDWRTKSTISLIEACKVLGIGRSLGYNLAAEKKFPGQRKIGSNIRISTYELRKYLGEVL